MLDNLDRRPQVRMNLLIGFAVLSRWIGRAQNLVPINDRGKGIDQAGFVEIAGKVNTNADVIGAACGM